MAETPKAPIVSLSVSGDDYVDGVRCAGCWDTSLSNVITVTFPVDGSFWPGVPGISTNTISNAGIGYTNQSGPPPTRGAPMTTVTGTGFGGAFGGSYTIAGTSFTVLQADTSGWEYYKGDKVRMTNADAVANGYGNGNNVEMTLSDVNAGNFENIAPFYTQTRAAQQAVIAEFGAIVAGACNLTFSVITEGRNTHGMMRWGCGQFSSLGSTGEPSPHNPHPTTYGDTWIQTGGGLDQVTYPHGSYQHLETMHEDGHTLGLKHPHDATESPMPLMGGTHNGTGDAFDRDSIEASMMSYRGYIGQAIGSFNPANGSFPRGPMVYDFAAWILNYGRSLAPRIVTVWSFDSTTGEEILDGVGQGNATITNKIFQTYYGKIDTWDVSNFPGVTLDLSPFGFNILKTSMLADLYAPGGHTARANVYTPIDTDPNYQIRKFIFGGGANSIIGNLRDNVFQPGNGTLACDGTAVGTNSILLSGLLREYIFAGAVCTDIRGVPSNGVTTMTNIQTVQTSDQTRPLATINKMRTRWGA